VLTVAPVVCLAGESAVERYEDDYFYDGNNRRMRARFDQGNRVLLESGYLSRWFLPTWRNDRAGCLALGMDLRSGCRDSSRDCWKVWHEILSARLTPGPHTGHTWPATDALLFGGRYIRYFADPYVTLPSAPARKMLIPFNVGFSLRVGGLHVPTQTVLPGWDLEVIDTRLLFELWRSPSLARTAQLGVGIRYNVYLKEYPEGTGAEHILSPFTATSLRYHVESARGFHSFDALVDAQPFWSDRHGWSMGVDARARYDLVVVAVNDQPLSLYASAGYRWAERRFDETARVNEFTVLAGMSLSVQLN